MSVLIEHLQTWLVLAVVALLSVFSDKLIGRIRFALNRADLRSKYYEELALDLSTFLFYVDLYHLRLVRGETSSTDMPDIGGEVNGSYVTLKTKEYVYRSWVRRYWSEAGIRRFEAVMNSALAAYEAIIEFNESGNESAKTQVLGDCLDMLRTNTEAWLSELDT
ncbi:hypothetical protein [Rhodanobacter sp. MP7CTX1]|uniref:hypothetical protein n=1 Tax=Rhodanobacter sp. MP7CTX1 TaxID=2723084 RepID=UPI00160F0C5A|nr:hypothetical protein [Rhodanobacter sp. MP7CTX1]MBB6187003.1 hypothetical protein [Rhodanobacter sp. MP7CTX1]